MRIRILHDSDSGVQGPTSTIWDCVWGLEVKLKKTVLGLMRQVVGLQGLGCRTLGFRVQGLGF